MYICEWESPSLLVTSIVLKGTIFGEWPSSYKQCEDGAIVGQSSDTGINYLKFGQGCCPWVPPFILARGWRTTMVHCSSTELRIVYQVPMLFTQLIPRGSPGSQWVRGRGDLL